MALISTFNKGYIYIENLVINYDNNVYNINNISTDKPYIYWSLDDRNNLICSDVRMTKDNYFYIIKNSKGKATVMDSEVIRLIFDNFDKVGISNSISTIKDDNQKYKVRLNEVSTDVEELSDIYKQDKNFTEIKESLNTSIVEYNSYLNILHSTLTTYLNDGLFNINEKSEIITQLNYTNNKSIQTLAYADALLDLYVEYNNDEKIKELSTPPESYKYKMEIEELIAYLDVNLTKVIESESEKFTLEDILPITSCIKNIIDTLSNLKTSCGDLVFLGSGGTISDQVNNTYNRIDIMSTNLNELQEAMLSNFDEEKKELQDYFNSVTTLLNRIDSVVYDAYSKNGVVSPSQSSTLLGYIVNLNIYVNKIIGVSENYHENDKLSSSIKKDLKSNMDNFKSKHDKYTKLIKDSIDDMKIVKSERSTLKISLTEYRNTKNLLNSKLISCINLINNSMAETSLKQIKTELMNEINAVKLKVDDIGTRMITLENKYKNLSDRIEKLEE